MKHTLLRGLVAASLLLTPARAADAPPPEDDRNAILAMAGEFAVHFGFRETLALQPGYEVKPDAYGEDAHELVLVAEDAGSRIRLQHLLVDQGRVIKHWAQIWTWQDTKVCEFQGHDAWKMRTLGTDEARGTWTQQVTQVDDSPRYESWGRWVHVNGVSAWTSQDTWRPLPRREHTKRKDYDVVAGTNRHVITPDGWAHEQDNTKTVVREGRVLPLVREAGLNTYRRITGFDFAPARATWEKDAAFWQHVVAVWEETQQTRPAFRIADGDDVPSLRRSVDDLRKNPTPDPRTDLRRAIRAKLDSAQ